MQHTLAGRSPYPPAAAAATAAAAAAPYLDCCCRLQGMILGSVHLQLSAYSNNTNTHKAATPALHRSLTPHYARPAAATVRPVRSAQQPTAQLVSARSCSNCPTCYRRRTCRSSSSSSSSGGAPRRIVPVMVEGHQCHRVGHAHRRLLLGKVFDATSPNGRFVEGEQLVLHL
jgi:hypothetical protein